MQSSNPVFARSEGFNGRSAGPAPSYQSDPSTWSTGAGAPTGYDTGYGAPTTPVQQGPMTIDTVVQKSAITLGTVAVVGAATWFYLSPITTNAELSRATLLAFAGVIVGFVLAMVNIFKKAVSPPLVIAYAAAQGVALGGLSLVIPLQFGAVPAGVVPQAVLGTVLVVASTLGVYKSGLVRVTTKFKRGVMIAGIAAVGLMLVNLVMSLFGVPLGIRGDGPLAIGFGLLMVGLGALFLMLDFDEIEHGIRNGLPESESWRSAFGLTVTIVWIYIEILRLVSIFNSSD
ncbi:Bax inhibitor-1/YccA family membrane protein [Solicola sp. PLA-1-18]|uniref:Bax inhibitor-1/YccA family protein n=1 Tax=Solicola sp. PLA-1-18 TaxID=3380532 RepID=UPI003B826CAA